MRVLLVLLVALGTVARSGSAQRPGVGDPAGGTVTGVIHDSLAGAPLAGALVQLVRVDDPAAVAMTASSDSAGRFRLPGVPGGRYAIGFLHAALDSLGIEAPVRTLVVDGRGPVQVELAVPGAATIRGALCAASPAADSGAAVFGVVRRAGSGAPVAGATVTVAWMEFTFGSGRFTQRMPRRSATTDPQGFYVLCNVPRGGTMAVVADLGADSTDVFDIEPPGVGLLRRDLHLGRSRAASAAVAGRDEPDSLDPVRGPLRAGEGRLRGIVVAEESGRAVEGARVGIEGGAATLTNERGEWLLSGLPTGTRTLEVRALGFYPVRRPVDVLGGAPPVRIAMATLRSVLDTVRIVASRLRLEGTGFDERRRSGMGRYLTANDIERRRVITIANLLGMLPGFRLERGTLGDTRISVRGPFGRCTPSVYIDGHHMRGLSAEDLDGWASPEEIAGMEIYTGAMVPPEFSEGMTGCGSIVIWTQRKPNPAAGWSWRRRLTHGGGAILLGIGLGALLGRL